MKYNILDFIACPLCKHFPLKLREARIGEEVDFISSFKQPYRCEQYCGYQEKKITDTIPAMICRECYSKTIEEGILFCENCGALYQIKDGIPKLIPDDLKSKEEDFILKAKKREMDVRNKPMKDKIISNLSSKRHQFLKQVEFDAVFRCLDPRAEDVVLDAGAGYGIFSIPISQRCKYIVATDFAFNTLKIFKDLSNNGFSTTYFTGYERFPEAKICLIQADSCHLPFRKDFHFSKILSTQVISHIPIGEQMCAIKEIYDHITENGIFVLTVGNDFLLLRLLRILKSRYSPKGETIRKRHNRHWILL